MINNKNLYEITIAKIERGDGKLLAIYEYRTYAKDKEDAEERIMDYHLANAPNTYTINSPFVEKIYISVEIQQ